MSFRIADFGEAEALLQKHAPSALPRNAYTLEYMQQFMDFLGNPQNEVPVIHVAGTSGKTSTCYYVASLLQAAGKRVGLSVSPYIDTMNERVQVNLTPLPERQFCDELAIFLELVNKSDVLLTRFEFLSAFAYWEFTRQRVDYVVMEVGMGGALDATNVIERKDKVCVITDIGLDHQGKLGNTLAEIAESKAGIIGLGNAVFSYEQSPEVLASIRGRARRKQADLHIIKPKTLPQTFDFLPLFQQRNFGLAKAVASGVSQRDGMRQLDEGSLLRAARVHIPARMEVFKVGGKTIILDGAHNAQKLEALKKSLQALYPAQPIAALVAFKAKQTERVEKATQVLTTLADHIIVTTYGVPNPIEPYGEDPQIVAALCKVHGFWQIETIAEPLHAWRQILVRQEPVIIVTGSFYLFNEIRPLLLKK